MINLNDYIKNPSSSSALSYWKANSYNIPEHIKVINELDVLSYRFKDKPHLTYFKLTLKLKDYSLMNTRNVKTYEMKNYDCLFEQINSCYKDGETITLEEIEKYKSNNVFYEDLVVIFQENNEILASGIATYDDISKEGSLEWIQVNKNSRNKGYGKEIVFELLNRLKNKAELVTVSGNYNNRTKTFSLYKSCGFKDNVLWYIYDES